MLPDFFKKTLLNHFDTKKLVEKKMPEFLMIEFLKNGKEVLSEDSRCWSDDMKDKVDHGSELVSGQVDRRSVKKVVDRRKGFNTV